MATCGRTQEIHCRRSLQGTDERRNEEQEPGPQGMRPRDPCRSASAGRVGTVVRRAADLPRDPAVVVLNPDDEVTPDTFNAWLDRRQTGEPVDPGVSAAETLAEARASGET